MTIDSHRVVWGSLTTALTDLYPPVGPAGAAAVATLSATGTRAIAISGAANRGFVLDAVAAGALGYVAKSATAAQVAEAGWAVARKEIKFHGPHQRDHAQWALPQTHFRMKLPVLAADSFQPAGDGPLLEPTTQSAVMMLFPVLDRPYGDPQRSRRDIRDRWDDAV